MWPGAPTAFLWGINGAMSVVASVFGALLAMFFGINFTFGAGFVAYAVAALALVLIVRSLTQARGGAADAGDPARTHAARPPTVTPRTHEDAEEDDEGAEGASRRSSATARSRQPAAERLDDAGGLVPPSTSIVMTMVVCTPPAISSQAVQLGPPRTRLPTGTGAGKRTLPVP